jgi:outer membrane protein TolC
MSVQTRYGISRARADNRFNANVAASVGSTRRHRRSASRMRGPLGRQTVSVGVNLPMVQWGAGRAAVEAAKSMNQRAVVSSKIQAGCARRGRAVLGASAPAGAAHGAARREGRHGRGKQFEVARNRYIIGKIANDALYLAQNEKDAAVLAYVQALRTTGRRTTICGA